MVTIETINVNLGADLTPVLTILNTILEKLQMNHQEQAALMNALADKFDKAKAEIIAANAQMAAALEAAGQSTPEIDAAAARLQALADALDALNPDAPAPAPEPAPAPTEG